MSAETDQHSDDDDPVELPAANHEISIEYECYYEDSLEINDGSVVEITDTDGHYSPDQEIYCECGMAFNSREAAREHLERKLIENRILPYPDLPAPLDWRDEPETVDGVHAIVESTNVIAKVGENKAYFQETARDQVSPPEAYGFSGWDELEAGGCLYHEECGQLFRAASLKRALAWVTGRATYYEPEDYTIYFWGHEPLLIEGPDRAVVVAPTE
jgi:hypothetical protein